MSIRSPKEEEEPLLLGTTMTMPLGLIQLAAGVEFQTDGRKTGDVEVGTIRLVKSERIPSGRGVMVRAKLDEKLGE